MSVPPRLFVTDCEGPLTRNDNAMEVCAAFLPEGAELFARLSRYDDFLADVLHKPGYNAGDTLRLIVPFLLAYGVRDRDIEEYSADTVLVVPGARDLLRDVAAALPAYIISTSYTPYLRALCRATGFPFAQCRCTKLDLDAWHLTADEAEWLRDRAEAVLEQPGDRAARGGAVGGRPVGRRPRRRRRARPPVLERHGAPGAAAAPRSWPPCGRWAAASSSRRCATSRPAAASSCPTSCTWATRSPTCRPSRPCARPAAWPLSFNGNRYALAAAELAAAAADTPPTRELALAFAAGGREGRLRRRARLAADQQAAAPGRPARRVRCRRSPTPRPTPARTCAASASRDSADPTARARRTRRPLG